MSTYSHSLTHPDLSEGIASFQVNCSRDLPKRNRNVSCVESLFQFDGVNEASNSETLSFKGRVAFRNMYLGNLCVPRVSCHQEWCFFPWRQGWRGRQFMSTYSHSPWPVRRNRFFPWRQGWRTRRDAVKVLARSPRSSSGDSLVNLRNFLSVSSVLRCQKFATLSEPGSEGFHAFFCFTSEWTSWQPAPAVNTESHFSTPRSLWGRFQFSSC